MNKEIIFNCIIASIVIAIALVTKNDNVVHILTVFSTIFIAFYNANKVIENFKEQETFKIKKEAIYETLEFLDDYISWMDLEENGCKAEAIRKEITTTELTLTARKCYNKLCTTCDNESLINIFVDLVFGESKNKVALFRKFRNEARKELELDEIHLRKDKIFIVEVSTAKLKEYEKTNKREKSEKEG